MEPTKIVVEHDNANAHFISEQTSLEYSINNQDNYVSVNQILEGSYNTNNIGIYEGTLSVHKGDVIWVKGNTYTTFGYVLIY